jgi:hypothetical protein
MDCGCRAEGRYCISRCSCEIWVQEDGNGGCKGTFESVDEFFHQWKEISPSSDQRCSRGVSTLEDPDSACPAVLSCYQFTDAGNLAEKNGWAIYRIVCAGEQRHIYIHLFPYILEYGNGIWDSGWIRSEGDHGGKEVGGAQKWRGRFMEGHTMSPRRRHSKIQDISICSATKETLPSIQF